MTFVSFGYKLCNYEGFKQNELKKVLYKKEELTELIRR